MQFEPHDYQAHTIDFIESHPVAAILLGMGLGKTIITLTAIDNLIRDSFTVRRALIIAPLRVARDTWPSDVEKWVHLDQLRVVNITGGPAERAAALRQDAPIFTTNYDNLPWLRDWFEDAKKPWPFRTVVADESTKLKGFRLRQGGVRAQALAGVAHKHTRRWVNLTGTPASNGLEDLWGQQWFIDAGRRLGLSVGSWPGFSGPAGSGGGAAARRRLGGGDRASARTAGDGRARGRSEPARRRRCGRSWRVLHARR